MGSMAKKGLKWVGLSLIAYLLLMLLVSVFVLRSVVPEEMTGLLCALCAGLASFMGGLTQLAGKREGKLPWGLGALMFVLLIALVGFLMCGRVEVKQVLSTIPAVFAAELALLFLEGKRKPKRKRHKRGRA